MAYVVVAYWKARSGYESQIRDAIRMVTTHTREEPGNLQFEAQVSFDDPAKFLIYEKYVDEQAFLEHRKAPYIQKYVLDYAINYLDSRELEIYETLGI